MRYFIAIGKILALILAVWLQTGVLHATDVDFGSAGAIGPSLTGTTGCESLPSNPGSSPKTFTVTATNASGVNWDDFTIFILTCPSGNTTGPGNGVSFPMNPRPTDNVAGTGSVAVHNFHEFSQSLGLNDEHFNIDTVAPGQSVSLTLPVNWGTTTSNFELQLIASTPTPEPASVELLGLGLIGIAGSIWRKTRRS